MKTFAYLLLSLSLWITFQEATASNCLNSRVVDPNAQASLSGSGICHGEDVYVRLSQLLPTVLGGCRSNALVENEVKQALESQGYCYSGSYVVSSTAGSVTQSYSIALFRE